MKSTFVSPVERRNSPSLLRKSVFNQFAKKTIFTQLNQLQFGLLIVKDGMDTFEFGNAEETHLVAEMHIQDSSAYGDIMVGGSIGAAESYMTGDWTTPDLTKVVRVLAKNLSVMDDMEGGLATLSKPFLKLAHFLRQNTEKGSRRNIAAHYDLGNDFFELFLDPSMMYSSGIFPHEDASMADASENKLRRICEKLQLCDTDRVVEIGTGWGGFAIFAAKHYGCHVTTTTISEQQFQLAKKRVNDEGLSHLVTLLKEDYRDLPSLTKDEGRFDKLVSIEMIEAVGWEYYETFFETCSRLLKPEALMLVQAITITDQRFEQAKKDVDFIKRFIFPGSCIPSVEALISANASSSDMRLVHHDDFAQHYARTLRCWNEQLHENLKKVKALGYSDDFIRMWEFYLCYCEGGFAERNIGVSHMVFAKPEFRYERII